jgi:hypothetical protein
MIGVGWTLEERPESVFPPWHGDNAVIYDTASGSIFDLGPGEGVGFSPDSRYATFVAGDRLAAGTSYLVGEVRILTLATGLQRVVGRGVGATFADNQRVALQLPRTPLENAKWELFDIDTLQRSADQTTPGQAPNERPTSTGHILRSEPVAGSDLPRGGHGATHYQVLDPATRNVLLDFEAFKVADAGPRELVVARALSGFPTEPFQPVHVQVYRLDVATGEAKWAGQAAASTPNWNLSGTDEYLLWTNNFCTEGEARPEVLLIPRDSLVYGYAGRLPGERLEPGGDEAWMFFTPSGLIAQGTFGATALIDPDTRKHVAVLPPVQLAEQFKDRGPVQPTWSPDYRYAAYWQGGGHGGMC